MFITFLSFGHFFACCENGDASPRNASIGVIVDFLISLFDKSSSISKIQGYRPAIAAIRGGFADGSGFSTLLFRHDCCAPSFYSDL